MTQPLTDPYATLGVPRDASEQQVRQAYRRLAMRYHPDRHPDGRTSERMRRVNGAWHILSSPMRRRRYDAAAQHPATQQRATPRRATPSTEPTDHHQSDGSGWPSALVTIVVAWLVLGTILFGFLPAPIIGLALLVAGRWILGGAVTR